jgi:mRNA interferase YafQ
MYKSKPSGQFKKDFILCIRRGYNMALIDAAIKLLCETGALPTQYSPHPLKGKWAGYQEAHIESDWLIVWKIRTDNVVALVRTGTHSDIFKK